MGRYRPRALLRYVSGRQSRCRWCAPVLADIDFAPPFVGSGGALADYHDRCIGSRRAAPASSTVTMLADIAAADR